MTQSPRGPMMLWSPPRCRSTAFLRMMSARGDVEVVHEPFSHVTDFGSADVDGVHCTDEKAVIAALRKLSARTGVFVKDTTDFHYPGLLADTDFLRNTIHSVIIRHPREAIASHHRLNPALTCEEIGFERVREIYQAAADTGAEPIVVDSDDLVDRPEATVRAFCDAVGIEFVADALTWAPEQLPAWQRAARWHTEVAQSTGFHRAGGAQQVDGVDVEDHPTLGPFYRHQLPHYEFLRQQKIPVPRG